MYKYMTTRRQKDFQDRLQSKMAEKKIDCLLLTTAENIFYATGYISGLYHAAMYIGMDMAIVPQQGRVSLVSSQFTQGGAELQTRGDVDVYGYPMWLHIEDYYDANEKQKGDSMNVMSGFQKAVELIKACGSKPVVGVELNTLPVQIYNYLANAVGADNIVNICDFMLKDVRLIKLPWEIDMLRESAKAAQQAMNITMQYIEPGKTEADIIRFFDKAVFDVTGGHELVYINQAHSVGPDFWATVLPRERPLENGDIVRLDAGLCLYGYLSDIARVFAVGDHVSPDKQAIFDTLLAARDVGVAMFRPGVRFCDVFNAVMKACHDGALPHFIRGHVGHTIGLGPGEDAPTISPSNTMEFRPGMVLCFETPYYSSKYGSYNLEDMIVITEDGHEMLTETPHTLFIK